MDDNQKGCAALFVAAIWIGVLVAMLVLGGNWRTDLAYSPAGGGADRFQNVVEFTEKLNAPHWLVGLVQGKDPGVQEAIEKHLGEGKALTRLVVTTRHSFVDNVLTLVTLGIYTPTTVTIRGAVGSVGEATPAPPPAAVPAPPAGAAPDTGR